MDQCFNLHLFDQDLILEKQYQWKNGFKSITCWSSTLKNFIFTTKNKQIYLVYNNITSIECIQTIQEQNWYSCACLDVSLFLTTNDRGTNIFEFNLLSIFELVQQRKSSHSYQEHKLIHDIIYNNQTLASMIENSSSNMISGQSALTYPLDNYDQQISR
jgi:hypothetical protein